jgi:hypothetical protein
MVAIQLMTPFQPLKAKGGYHKFEFFDADELWKQWAQLYIEQHIPLIVEPKYDGIRLTAHKRGRDVKIFTEDAKRDRAHILLDVVEEIRKLPADELIIDGEMVIWGEKAPIPRHEMIKIVVAKQPLHERFHYNIFDLLWLNGKNLTTEPLENRLKALARLLPKDLEYLKRVRGWKVSSKAEFDKAIKKAADFPGSEGAMIKSAASQYLLGRTAEWAKYKTAFEIKVQVIGILRKPNPWPKAPAHNLVGAEALNAFKRLQKASQTFILRGAILSNDGKKLIPIESDHKLTPGDLEVAWNASRKQWTGTEDPRIWEMGLGFSHRKHGEYAYANTYGKRFDPAPKTGDIVTVRPIGMRSWRDDGIHYSWMFPIIQEIDPERNKPDTVSDADRIVAATSARTPGKLASSTQSDVIHAKTDYSRYLNWRIKLPPNKYPKFFAILATHFRGQSAHADFRVKMDGYLQGFTIDDLPEGAIKEDIDTLADAHRALKSVPWKFGPNMDPNKHVLSQKKATQPILWLNASREKVYPPGSVGACITSAKVLTPIAWVDIQRINHRLTVASKFHGESIWSQVVDTIHIAPETKESYEIKVGPHKTIATYDHLWHTAFTPNYHAPYSITRVEWSLTKDIFALAYHGNRCIEDEDGQWYEHPFLMMAVPVYGLPDSARKDLMRWDWQLSANGWYLLHRIKIRQADIPSETFNLSIKNTENYLTTLGYSHNTRFEEGVFATRAVGMAFPGVQKPWFKEFFLDMVGPYEDYRRKRLVFRLVETAPPEKQRSPLKQRMHWEAWITKNDTPYLLTARARRKRDYVPPADIGSGLPPWWEEKIPPELRWWGKKLSRNQALDLMDRAYEYLKKLARQKKITLAARKVKFALKRHWWKGQCISPRTYVATPEGFVLARKLKRGMTVLSADLQPLQIVSAKKILFPRAIKIVIYPGSVFLPDGNKPDQGQWVVKQWHTTVSENTPLWIKSKDHMYEGWVQASSLKCGDYLKIPVFICPSCGFRGPLALQLQHKTQCFDGTDESVFTQRLVEEICALGHTLFVYVKVQRVQMVQKFTPLISIEVHNPLAETHAFLTHYGPVHNTVVRDMPIEHWDLIIESPNKTDILDEYQFENNPINKPGPLAAHYKQLKTPPSGSKDVKSWFKWEGEIPPGQYGNPNKRIPAYIETVDQGDVQLLETSDLFKSFIFNGGQLKGYYIMRREDPGSPFWQFSKSSTPGQPRHNKE